jgi:hypothetical protein
MQIGNSVITFRLDFHYVSLAPGNTRMAESGFPWIVPGLIITNCMIGQQDRILFVSVAA